MILLDGKKLADIKTVELKKETDYIYNTYKKYLKLVIILIGDNKSSQIYVKHKIEKAKELNIKTELITLDKNINEDEVLNIIDSLNHNVGVTGILLQLPISKHLNTNNIINRIDPNKDVDGLHYVNQGKLLLNQDTIFPCTPLGIINLLQHYNISFDSKNITIFGTSNIVGKPLAIMLSNLNATVTMCNNKTINKKDYTLKSDIIITATGQKNILTNDMIKDNTVVVDVGIIRDKETNKIIGDVDFINIKNKCSYITPVPGGVGPMTVISVFENLISIFNKNNKKVI